MHVHYILRKQSTTTSSKTKAQYNLDIQTAKISALSSGNVSKYEFLTGKDDFTQKKTC